MEVLLQSRDVDPEAPRRLRPDIPLDMQTILGSIGRTHRLFTVEENPRLCGWGAEIVSIVAGG